MIDDDINSNTILCNKITFYPTSLNSRFCIRYCTFGYRVPFKNSKTHPKVRQQMNDFCFERRKYLTLSY